MDKRKLYKTAWHVGNFRYCEIIMYMECDDTYLIRYAWNLEAIWVPSQLLTNFVL